MQLQESTKRNRKTHCRWPAPIECAADRVSWFFVQGGVARELWIEISPRSFNVRVRDGLALTQLMVFMPWDKALERFPPPRPSAMLLDGRASASSRGVGASGVSMDMYDEKLCFDQSGEPVPLSLHKGAVVLSVCVPKGGRALSGYEALQTEDIIDLGEVLDSPSPCLTLKPHEHLTSSARCS